LWTRQLAAPPRTAVPRLPVRGPVIKATRSESEPPRPLRREAAPVAKPPAPAPTLSLAGPTRVTSLIIEQKKTGKSAAHAEAARRGATSSRLPPEDPLPSVSERTTALIGKLRSLPSNPSVGLRVVQLTGSNEANASRLGQLVETDPALTARAMRLANSAYFGLVRRVRSAHQAVVVLGFETVQTLAVAATAGLYDDSVSPAVPEGFWMHAAAVASGAAAIASAVGLSKAEAFSAGLLHDLGSALLHRSDPKMYAEITAKAGNDTAALTAAEIEVFGVDHGSAGADVLDAWGLPQDTVAALRDHQQVTVLGSYSRMAVVIAAADALAGTLEGAPQADGRIDTEELLFDAGIERDMLSTIAARVIEGASVLASAFG
jgi:putative nucleotidyltransferase with HDIG domain